mmetsp:Transcript_10669/g.20737  ORF Transcript_10669/g.20737 Transcript_10669/m.20737 type:complete len:317 (+) Transcript_10669:3514-4464(+)
MTEVAKAVAAVKSLLALQLLLKAATFAFNIIIARAANPEDYGVANVDLTLVTVAVMFFSKENIRRAAQRAKRLESAESLMWIGIGLDALVAVGAYWFIAKENTAGPILIVCFAGLLESLGEPFYAKSMIDLDATPRIRAEAIGTILKCIVTYAALPFGLMAFALGLLVQSTSIMLCYIYYRKGLPTFKLPIEGEVVQASLEMTGMVLLKFLLSEWEKIILMVLYTAQESVFALVSNLGSVVCRILFSPIEVASRQEITHTLFTKKMQPGEAESVIPALMSLMWTIGLFMSFYGQIFSDITISWLFGAKWTALVRAT